MRGSKVISCPFCDKKFKSASWLKRHARGEHLTGNRCPVCSKEFSKDDSLLKHFAHLSSKCDKHLVVWYLARESKGKGLRRSEMSRRAFELMKGGLRI